MDTKVQAFLDEAKKNKLLHRNKHLIFLGLTDDDKNQRKYFNYFVDGSEFDKEKQLYYKDYPTAVEVTDDEYDEICKYAEKIESNVENKANSPEKTLSIIATMAIWIGIICSIVLFFAGLTCISSYSTKELGYSLLIAIIPLLASFVITWAVLKVLCNISNNLREINHKTK